MVRISKKAIIIFCLLLINVPIVFLFLTSRSLSHLAVWKVIESGNHEDFYWHPEEAPDYFHFELQSKKLSIFENEVLLLVRNESDGFVRMLKVAQHVAYISRDERHGGPVRWDSPNKILLQMKSGAIGNCFHRAIVFSSYIASLGMYSRLWALENENFDGVAHSVCEVYIKDLKKWVFIDVMSGFYVKHDEKILSLLELREALLRGEKENIIAHYVNDRAQERNHIPHGYDRLIRRVFLRADNDFVYKYDKNIRYGFLAIFHEYIDKLPDSIRRGLDYSLGRKDIFVHYHDVWSNSLMPKIVLIKLLFYCTLISTPLAVFLIFLIFAEKLHARHTG